MTIETKIETELVECGLWQHEAKAVLNMLKSDEGLNDMKSRWGEDLTAYPMEFLAVLLLTAKRKAVEWIDQNKPKHFARNMLTA